MIIIIIIIKLGTSIQAALHLLCEWKLEIEVYCWGNLQSSPPFEKQMAVFFSSQM